MSVQILLVDTDSQRAAQLSVLLQHADFTVTRVAAFEDAIKQLRATPTDMLITTVRLGAYNGLHLIMRARAECPQIVAIAISPVHDPVLEAEAASFGAVYAVAPWNDPKPFFDLVGRVAHARTRVARISSPATGPRDISRMP